MLHADMLMEDRQVSKPFSEHTQLRRSLLIEIGHIRLSHHDAVGFERLGIGIGTVKLFFSLCFVLHMLDYFGICPGDPTVPELLASPKQRGKTMELAPSCAN